ncbi:hypothetical protein GA0115259_100395 [Streptomyces sp. MnatMP-M17]|nr:hypothetical protein GA0115259_100395 [Streptomyces sp. MnatMP-M17]
MAQLGDSAEALRTTMRDRGFNVYRLADDYRPASYPTALRGAPSVPPTHRRQGTRNVHPHTAQPSKPQHSGHQINQWPVQHPQ